MEMSVDGHMTAMFSTGQRGKQSIFSVQSAPMHMTSYHVHGIDDQIERRIEQVSNLIGQYVDFWLRSKFSLNSNLTVSSTLGTFMS